MDLIDLLHADRQRLPARSLQRWIVRFAVSLILLILIVVATSVGIAVFRSPHTGSPEAIFARAMATHHAQAVEMAVIIRDRSTDTDLRQFALDVILTQQSQIGQMDGWLAVWGLSLGEPEMTVHGAMPGMVNQQDVNALRTLPEQDAEIIFLRLMIRHHKGGVQMAQDVLRKTSRSEVMRLAQAIVAAQQNEIAYMQSLLAIRDAAPAQAVPAMQHGDG